MVNELSIEQISSIFYNKDRVTILSHLMNRRYTATQLVVDCNIPSTSVYRILGVLEKIGVIERVAYSMPGKEKVYLATIGQITIVVSHNEFTVSIEDRRSI